MFTTQLRQAIEAAPRENLPDVARALWAALLSGNVTESDAEALDALIQARTKVSLPISGHASAPRVRVGSRPRSDASMERRRRWAAAGRLPPQIACKFTLAEQATLAVVAAEIEKRGDCRLANEHIGSLAGVAKATVRAALRRARDLGIITSTERRSTAWRNLTNVVQIVSPEWQAWMRLTRRGTRPGGGDISSLRTSTSESKGRILNQLDGLGNEWSRIGDPSKHQKSAGTLRRG